MSKLLAIDDEKSNLDLIKATLKRYIPDCQLLIAYSADEGIEIARKELPDTILLDIMMPGLNGFEACQILKEDASTNHIPIIMFSAYVKDSERIIKGLDLGADAFLEKPIDPAELAAQVRVMMRIKKAEDNLKNEILKYRIMSETLPDAVVTVNIMEEITYISPVAVELFGLDNKIQYEKYNVFSLLFFSKPEKIRNFLNELLLKERILDFELPLYKKDNQQFFAEISASLLNSESDKPKEFIIVIRDISNRKQIESEILSYQDSLKSLNSQLTKVEESERKSIAGLLHDGIGQMLSMARMNLTSISSSNLSKEVNTVLQESSELLNKAIKETRNLTFDLSPPILYELGLISAIKWRADQIEQEHGIKTSLVYDQNPINLIDSIKILLYRIISELFSNIIKHAKANMIEINCFYNNEQLNISIEDNGIGFNYNPNIRMKNNDGYGLFSINERLDSIDGKLDIFSEINKGTKATIVIPLKTK